MSSPDYILDIEGLSASQDLPADASEDASLFHDSASHNSAGRPWLAIQWKCCSAYSRIYRNRNGTAYEGYCPKCAKPLRVKIGPRGTNHRFFEAS